MQAGIDLPLPSADWPVDGPAKAELVGARVPGVVQRVVAHRLWPSWGALYLLSLLPHRRQQARPGEEGATKWNRSLKFACT